MRKRVLTFLVEVIVLCLCLVSLGLFYQSKIFYLTIENYRSGLKSIDRFLTKTIEISKAFRENNKRLKVVLKESREENKKLKEKLTKLKINADTVAPIKEKIKYIATLIDDIDITSRDRRSLNSLLHSIYTELNSLDFNIAKLARDEPIYQERFKQTQAQLQEKLVEIEDLKSKLKDWNQALKRAQEKIELLEKEKNDYILNLEKKDKEFRRYKDVVEKQLKSYQTQIADLLAEKQRLVAQLNQRIQESERIFRKLNLLEKEKERIISEKIKMGTKISDYTEIIDFLNTQIQVLGDRLKKLEEENKQLTLERKDLRNKNLFLAEDTQRLKDTIRELKTQLQNSKAEVNSLTVQLNNLNRDYQEIKKEYELTKEKINQAQLQLAQRADKILNLQEALEEKDNSILELNIKLKEQLKELVDLREDMIEVKLGNSRLLQELRLKEETLKSLNEEIKRISWVNSQLKAYVERASKLFIPKEETSQTPEVKEEKTRPPATEKEVRVEIQSIQSEEEGSLNK
jgi:chromosome segregation ATPase